MLEPTIPKGPTQKIQRTRLLVQEVVETKTPKEPKAPKEPRTPKALKTPGGQVERAPKRGPGRPAGYSPITGYNHPQPLNDLSSPEKYTAWVPSSNQYVPQGFSELSDSFTHSKVRISSNLYSF